jgi:hypothetical protein
MDFPSRVRVSPSCTELTVPVMRPLPVITPQKVAPDAGTGVTPSPPPQAERQLAKKSKKDHRMQAS